MNFWSSRCGLVSSGSASARGRWAIDKTLNLRTQVSLCGVFRNQPANARGLAFHRGGRSLYPFSPDLWDTKTQLRPSRTSILNEVLNSNGPHSLFGWKTNFTSRVRGKSYPMHPTSHESLPVGGISRVHYFFCLRAVGYHRLGIKAGCLGSVYPRIPRPARCLRSVTPARWQASGPFQSTSPAWVASVRLFQGTERFSMSFFWVVANCRIGKHDYVLLEGIRTSAIGSGLFWTLYNASRVRFHGEVFWPE